MFKRKAAEQVAVLTSSPFVSSGNIESTMNSGETKPRRGAFEILVEREDGKTSTVWSGLKLGPPRRLKFPDPNSLLTSVQKFLEG